MAQYGQERARMYVPKDFPPGLQRGFAVYVQVCSAIDGLLRRKAAPVEGSKGYRL